MADFDAAAQLRLKAAEKELIKAQEAFFEAQRQADPKAWKPPTPEQIKELT